MTKPSLEVTAVPEPLAEASATPTAATAAATAAAADKTLLRAAASHPRMMTKRPGAQPAAESNPPTLSLGSIPANSSCITFRASTSSRAEAKQQLRSSPSAQTHNSSGSPPSRYYIFKMPAFKFLKSFEKGGFLKKIPFTRTIVGKG